MTDEQSPESASRRARLATRRKRVRFVGIGVTVVVLVVGVTTAFATRQSGGSSPTPTTRQPKSVALARKPPLGRASGLRPPRIVSHADPLKLWIGGDSLAGSFGPALGQMAGGTGVVDATIDYKVSSGLADDGIRDWYEHAQEAMASQDPDAVVFIIGTNDVSIVNSYDANHDGVPDWEPGYRAKIDRMMQTFVGGARHRTVFWLAPPTLGDDTLNAGAKAMGPIMRQEAAKFAPDVVFVDTYRLFADANGDYSRSLPDAHGTVEEMRISDGVHFTVDGANYLAGVVWKLLDRRWELHEHADPSQPIDYTIAPGSNDYVPGVGYYRPTITEGYSATTTLAVESPTTVAPSSTVGEPSTTKPVSATTTPTPPPSTKPPTPTTAAPPPTT